MSHPPYESMCLLCFVFTGWSQCDQPLKSLNQPQRYESIPPNILPLTTTKSPVIPDTLLRCQSCWPSQRNCLTVSPCEAEDKAKLLNEIQAHNSNASVHLTFPPSLSNPPPPQRSQIQPTSKPVHTQTLPHSLCSFPAPRYCVNTAVDYTKHFAVFRSQQSESEERQRAWGKHGINVWHATTIYLCYCCGNTFLLFHAAANTILRSRSQVTL